MAEGLTPRLIAWEVTRSCNLQCRHCRASAQHGPYPNEFSTAECMQTLNKIAAFAKPIIILTGGEPLLRPDIFEIAQHGTSLGLRMVLATCGGMLDVSIARQLKDSGIQRISLSLDGATADTHDDFRQTPGAFDAALHATDVAKSVGLEFQINTTITKRNLSELAQILNLAVRIGAAAYHPFLLVPTGRGAEMADEALSPEEYECTLNWIYEQRALSPIPFKPTCAPHYYRILRQRENAVGRSVSPQTHGLDAMTKGCMGGQSFAFISHTGKAQICGFLEQECGDLRTVNYDFKTIWETSPVFQEMRQVDDYHGRCGYCDYRQVCGGCRARAYAMTGDYLAEEPFCIYTPKREDTANH
ncbi:TPA: heme b synthase, partial [Candidatus Sumerlaeota bacterium]|nr:heme b synthase [Candidatus Sumerlaeota bacterium]